MPDTPDDRQAEHFSATVISSRRPGEDPIGRDELMPLDEHTAMGMPAYFSGVRFLSSALAMLPAGTYRRTETGREPLGGRPARILQRGVNELVTNAVFWETFWHHAVTWGNGYALIERDRAGTPQALYNLPPDRVVPLRVDGQTWYAMRNDDGVTPVRARNVLHVPGLGFDGLKGYQPIRVLADAMGLGRSAARWAKKFYEEGAHLGGVISSEAKLTPEQLADVRAEINERHSGLDKAARWMVLMGGASVTPLGAPPETAKLVEVLGVSVNQVAQILRVPPHVLYDLGRATWANIEHMGRELVQFTLGPWLVKAEQELGRKLFTRPERDRGAFVKFNVDALLRGDHKARLDGYRLGLSEGIYTVNEVRRMEDLPPIREPWADAHRVPANAMPASRLTAPALPSGDEDADREVRPPGDEPDAAGDAGAD